MNARLRIRSVGGGLLLAGVVALLAGHGRPPSTPNLLIITLDTTRADRLGAYGSRLVSTPNLDWIARTGVLFEQATTVAPLTLPAHCSLFTGRFPPGHGVRDNNGFVLAPSHVTLAEVLGASGFRTGACPSSFVLDRRSGVGRGFDTYDDDFGIRREDAAGGRALRRSAGETVDHATSWIARSSSSPFFAWIHLYDAHAPYDPPEPYRTLYPGRPYDGCVAFLDAQVGRLVRWLSQHALLDHTLIVVMADHGESLGEHGEWTHGLGLYQSVLHVPLIVRLPTAAHAGLRIGAVVRNVDVMPTVLSVLGAAAPAGIDGVSLEPLMTRARDDFGLDAYAETLYPQLRLGLAARWTLRSGRLKLISQDRRELFDVVDDPHETNNLAAAHPAPAAELERRLEVLQAPSRRAVPTVNVDADRQQRLAALGYLSR